MKLNQVYSTLDSVKRFSNRVENYALYRPKYPDELIDTLEREFGLTPGMTVADVGSGTGISAKPFLIAGYKVIGIEPNAEMRMFAEKYLKGRESFVSIDGTAAATTLPDQSVDAIVAAQAFHWFDNDETKRELRRILKPGGMVFLIWNRKVERVGLMNDYFDLLIEFGTDYDKVRHESHDTERIRTFFEPNAVTYTKLNNEQLLDYAGFEGRLLSSSYIPLEGKRFDEMIIALREMFNKYQSGGKVRIEYETDIYAGKLAG